MPVVDVKNLDGKKVGQVELADGVFAAKVNPHLLHETTRWYLNSQRAGTHKTKGRSDVAGSGRKLWKQKGTGRARIGSIRSPLWRKGGTVHGPQPRSYGYRLPKKMILGALRSALSTKLAEDKLIVLDALTPETHKSKAFRTSLTKLDGTSRTILLVDNASNHNLELASRNLDGVKVALSRDLQVYDLLRHEGLMLSRDAALRLNDSLALEEKGEMRIAQAPLKPAGPGVGAAEEKKPARPVAAKSGDAKSKELKPKAAKAAAKPKAPKGKGKGKE
jgi:large subunit ribosomal protein L4